MISTTIPPEVKLQGQKICSRCSLLKCGSGCGENVCPECTTALDNKRSPVPPPFPWVWQGFLARGAVTLLIGDPKSAGKSYLAFGALAQIAQGKPFLERPTQKTKTLYLIDEPNSALAEKVRLFGHGEDAVQFGNGRGKSQEFRRVLMKHDLPEQFERAGAGLLVVDNLWAWPQGNSPEQTLYQLSRLAKDKHVAVLALHYPDEFGLPLGGRALSKSADIILRLTNPQGRGPERMLELIGRLGQVHESSTVVLDRETEPYTYRLIRHTTHTANEAPQHERQTVDLAPKTQEGAYVL